MNNNIPYNQTTNNNIPGPNYIHNNSGAYNTTIPPYAVNKFTVRQEDAATLDFRDKMARKLGLGSLIYAFIFTICLYNNLTGITMPLFGIATIIYMVYALKLYDIKIKKLSWFYASVFMALTISNFLTGNMMIQLFNLVGIIFMIFIFLLHNVYDDERWNFSKTTLACIESFFYSIGAMDDFAKDMRVRHTRSKEENIESSKKSKFKYVLLGLVIAIPVTGIILILLSEADKVFNVFLSEYLSFDIRIGTVLGIIITFAISFFGSYCILRFFSKKVIKEEVTDKRSLEPIIAITVLSIISVIYLIFSVIQILYLFWGGMKLPENYTYAQYAREGFFQLLAVSIINFMIVLFVNNHFRENLLLKILMTIISICTYIMIASSCMRMLLYIDAYLLTTLRILVLWGLAVLSILFIAVIISIYKHSFPLFRYSIIVVSILYLLLGFAHPDYIIASYNLSHMDNDIKSKKISQDYEYLTNLSSDAAPAIYSYKEQWADQYFNNNSYCCTDKSIRKFNLSAYTFKTLKEYR